MRITEFHGTNELVFELFRDDPVDRSRSRVGSIRRWRSTAKRVSPEIEIEQQSRTGLRCTSERFQRKKKSSLSFIVHLILKQVDYKGNSSNWVEPSSTWKQPNTVNLNKEKKWLML